MSATSKDKEKDINSGKSSKSGRIDSDQAKERGRLPKKLSKKKQNAQMVKSLLAGKNDYDW